MTEEESGSMTVDICPKGTVISVRTGPLCLLSETNLKTSAESSGRARQAAAVHTIRRIRTFLFSSGNMDDETFFHALPV